jgi:dihydroflavonol-4-reductase
MTPKDPDEVIKPAVEGTLRVLQAAARQLQRPRRVVITSSVAAVLSGHRKDVYTDDDWSDLEQTEISVSPYARSKTLAEKAAWNFVNSLPSEQKFELATINPSVVLGPMLSNIPCPSANLIIKALLGKYPGLPNVPLSLISVYDVARAHLLAMIIPEAANKRFVLSAQPSGLRPICATLDTTFRSYGYKPTTLHLPDWLVRSLAWFGNEDCQTACHMLGRRNNMPCTNARQILGLSFTSEFDLVVEMARASIAAGLITDLSKDQTLTKSYQRPEFDLSMIPPPGLITEE